MTRWLTTSRATWLVVALAVGHDHPLLADDAASLVQSTVDLGRTIRALDAEDFAVRRAARSQLIATGLPAVEHLRAAADDAAGHLAAECVTILEHLSHSQDAALSGAARQALLRLSQSGRPAVSELAQAAIQPAEPLPAHPSDAARMRAIVGARLNVGLFGPPFVDGRREANFTDAGRDVKITEVHGGKISVSISALVEGVERTTVVEADNQADLLRKDRAAHELYTRRFLRPPIGPAAIPMGILPGVNGMRRSRIAVEVSNGQRKIEIEEEGRRLRIEDADSRQIRMEWTETVNGQVATRRLEATDLEALQAADPRAAEEFRKYTETNVAGYVVRRTGPRD